jgi:predicted acetyltransferase
VCKADSAPGNVRIAPATIEHKPVLANLLELYCHDFCDFLKLTIGADGRFGYSALDLYWTDKERFPFLVRVQEDLGGFVFVHRLLNPEGGSPIWDIAEFFILRGFRGHGVGKEALRQIYRTFPGPWQVRVMVANRAACQFWKNAIAQMVGNAVEPTQKFHSGQMWYVFSFR